MKITMINGNVAAIAETVSDVETIIAIKNSNGMRQIEVFNRRKNRKCQKCAQWFIGNIGLARHLAVTHEIKGGLATFKNGGVPKKAKRNWQKKECAQCGKILVSAGALNFHRYTAHGKKRELVGAAS